MSALAKHKRTLNRERQRRQRDRDRRHIKCYLFEVDDFALADALICSQRLTEEQTERRALVQRAIRDILNDFIDRWRN
jgi:hypothetical protein